MLRRLLVLPQPNEQATVVFYAIRNPAGLPILFFQDKVRNGKVCQHIRGFCLCQFQADFPLLSLFQFETELFCKDIAVWKTVCGQYPISSCGKGNSNVKPVLDPGFRPQSTIRLTVKTGQCPVSGVIPYHISLSGDYNPAASLLTLQRHKSSVRLGHGMLPAGHCCRFAAHVPRSASIRHVVVLRRPTGFPRSAGTHPRLRQPLNWIQSGRYPQSPQNLYTDISLCGHASITALKRSLRRGHKVSVFCLFIGCNPLLYQPPCRCRIPADFLRQVPAAYSAFSFQPATDKAPERAKHLILHPGAENIRYKQRIRTGLFPGRSLQAALLQNFCRNITVVLFPQAFQHCQLPPLWICSIRGLCKKFCYFPLIPAGLFHNGNASVPLRGIHAGHCLPGQCLIIEAAFFLLAQTAHLLQPFSAPAFFFIRYHYMVIVRIFRGKKSELFPLVRLWQCIIQKDLTTFSLSGIRQSLSICAVL